MPVAKWLTHRPHGESTPLDLAHDMPRGRCAAISPPSSPLLHRCSLVSSIVYAKQIGMRVALIGLTMAPLAAPAQMPGGHVQPPPTPKARPPENPANLGAPVLVQLDQLETELKLTPEQRPAWNAYTDKVLRLADDTTRSRFAARASPNTDLSAVQQLEALTDTERNRLTAIEDITAAGKAFYATLSSEQKSIADRKLLLPIRPLATGVALPGSPGAGAANR